jgi:Xaa-Pro aminopeptidase
MYKGCLQHIKSTLEVGQPTRLYQQKACDFYNERGYITISDNPATLEGYVHGLGHGVGLDIHEAPAFSDNPANTATITPGQVFTIEPGLYYPEQGMGCRIEDVVWIDNDGKVHTLTDFAYELVVPMENAK